MTTEITKILKGFKRFSNNPYEDSIKFLREYIEVEPTSEAFFELGKALFFNGDYEKSLASLKKSEDFRCDAYIGLDYFKMNDHESAITHFKRFLKEKQNETILSYLMLSLEKTHEWKDAIICGEILLEINPENDSVKLHLADSHFKRREYERSLLYLSELEGAKYKYRKGLILFKLKRYDEAIEELKNIKTLDSYRLMSRSYEKLGKHTKAVMCMQNAYKRYDDIEILFEISEIHFKNNNYQNSINLLERILRDDSKNERALEMIAKNYFGLQNFELALSYCNDLLEVNKDSFKAYLIMSETCMYLDDSKNVLEYVEKGLEINPHSAELWIQKAWAYYPTDFELFKRAFEKALELEPNNIKNHLRLIEECHWMKDEESARRYYDRLIFYNPSYTESFEEMQNRILNTRN